MYTLRIKSPDTMAVQGNYRTGVFDAGFDVNRLVFNQTYFDQTDPPFGKDRWTSAIPAGSSGRGWTLASARITANEGSNHPCGTRGQSHNRRSTSRNASYASCRFPRVLDDFWPQRELLPFDGLRELSRFGIGRCERVEYAGIAMVCRRRTRLCQPDGFGCIAQ